MTGLDYRSTDMGGQGGRWVRADGVTIGYSLTEDSAVYNLKGCGQ